MIIGVVVGVDTVILIVGTALPQSRLNATLEADEEHPTEVDVSFTGEGDCKEINLQV